MRSLRWSRGGGKEEVKKAANEEALTRVPACLIGHYSKTTHALILTATPTLMYSQSNNRDNSLPVVFIVCVLY